MTFQQICDLEPEIQEIYTAAKNLKTGENASYLWRANFQPRLDSLVGSHAKQPMLRSYDVFALTIDTVWDVLEAKPKWKKQITMACITE